MGSDHPSADYGFIKKFDLKGTALVEKDHEVNLEIGGWMTVPERNSTLELAPDGKEHKAQPPALLSGTASSGSQTIVEWQGNNLVVSVSSPAYSMRSSRRYLLSDDGAELVEIVISHSAYGDSEQRLVSDRIVQAH